MPDDDSMVIIRDPVLERLYTDLPMVDTSKVPEPEIEVPEGANLGPIVENNSIKRFVGVIGQYKEKIEKLSQAGDPSETSKENARELALYQTLYKTANSLLGLQVGMIYNLIGKQIAICKGWQLVWRDPPQDVEMVFYRPGGPFGEDSVELRRVRLE